MKTKGLALFAIALIVIPLGLTASDADDAPFLGEPLLVASGSHIGGTGHGDGIDVEYTEQSTYNLFVTLSSTPSGNIRLSIISAEHDEVIEQIRAEKVFAVDIKQLSAGQYTILLTLMSDNSKVAECTLTVGDAYYLTYQSDGGSGSMLPSVVDDGKVKLRSCEFSAPSGKSFKAWSVNGTEYKAGASVSLSADATAIAVWQEGSTPSEGGSDDSMMIIIAAVIVILVLIVAVVLLMRRKV